MYGIAAIGTVRSVFTTVIIISTAQGPAAFGLVQDAGFSFASLLQMSLGVLFLTFLLSMRVYPSFFFRRLYLSLVLARTRK